MQKSSEGAEYIFDGPRARIQRFSVVVDEHLNYEQIEHIKTTINYYIMPLKKGPAILKTSL